MALRSRVKELEAQLAAAGLGPQSADAPSSAYSHMQPLDRDKSPGQTSHGGFSDVGSKATAQTPESTADAIATGLFDHPPVVDIGYFGEPRAPDWHPSPSPRNSQLVRLELQSRLLLVSLSQHRKCEPSQHRTVPGTFQARPSHRGR